MSKIFEYAENQNREQIKTSQGVNNQILGFVFILPLHKRIKPTVHIVQTASFCTLNIIADHRAGKEVIIPLNIEEYGLNGLYLITSANHRIYRNREEIAVNLKKREEKTT